MYGTPLPKKPKPYVAGLVRGQLPRSPLREATKLEVTFEQAQPARPVLDYPSRAETPNEKSRRMLGKKVKVLAKIKPNPLVIEFTPEEWARIL